ncbi:MAG: 3-isopropylmalate dehydrogenase, partial [Pseudomonadaceae bacterium]|nr:3-isopropylmalate dehydrogenase [Pseudomonadaceae bacterium]
MTQHILVLPGDGIGPEITAQAVKVMEVCRDDFGVDISWEEAPVGGAGYDAAGHPLPPETLAKAKAADAIVLGAVGGPKWDKLEDISLRP